MLRKTFLKNKIDNHIKNTMFQKLNTYLNFELLGLKIYTFYFEFKMSHFIGKFQLVFLVLKCTEVNKKNLHTDSSTSLVSNTIPRLDNPMFFNCKGYWSYNYET